MRSSLRLSRSILLIICGILPLTIDFAPEGLAMLMGMVLLTSASLTALFIFIHFDKKMDQKTLMEGLIDAFSGLILFTYPQAITSFLLTDIAFWSFLMGTLYLAAGLFDFKNKAFLWLYSLTGIVMVVLGFVLMNYDPAEMVSAFFVLSFVFILYGLSNLYLMYRKKGDIY